MKSPRNYYNEFDPKAAAWLRELIKAGLIPDGDVDERSIEDVTPAELHGYTQCHFFAGIAGWVHALDLAGWPRDRPVWTGSCPCQPFSAAGQGAGFADERHLWPAWQHLIAQCRPAVVFGEQVASKAADAWIDLVHADMEGMGYAFGSVPFPAAGVGAPHIRDRNYWVGLADPDNARLEGRGAVRQRATEFAAGPRGVDGRLADSCGAGSLPGAQRGVHSGEEGPRARHGELERQGATGGLADPRSERRGGGQGLSAGRLNDGEDAGRVKSHDGPVRVNEVGDARGAAGPVNGHWAAADWIGCRDGKWRPVEPGTQPLAHGIPGRVVRLRGYGNAIVPQQAAQFVIAFCESLSAEVREAA